jgi:indole-3-glycerol phosphate synthase
LGDDVPDDIGRISPEYWKSSVGLRNFNAEPNDATFMLLPSPSFQNDLDDFLRGMSMSFPGSTIFGGIASTVSSLSRARLFRYDAMDSTLVNTLADGCVGIAIAGDVQAKVMVSQGAKPVGGVYRIVSGQDSTISAIQLDETATSQLEDTIESLDKDDEEEDETDKKKIAAAAYAKAVIPKPVLAEANYLMKTLSDDDQAFMRKSILVGLENSGGIAKTPNELLRLAAGQGHRFTVHQVASAGMKDGSITLPLGTVEIELGGRLRFFVRDGTFAKEEVDAIWTGYKKKELEQTFLVGEGGKKGDPFVPSGCFFFPSLDRGTKLFGGRPGYESKRVTEYLPNIPTIGGFFTNGCIAALDEDDSRVMVHGSASCYAVIGSKTKRPSYSAAQAATENMEAKLAAEKAAAIEKRNAEEDEKRTSRAKGLAETSDEKPAPRAENGELILKRREVHSGRALTVSNVEWSVVENMATPTSALEGFMWDKETEIDRQRERVPLSNLVSQCRLSDLDPSKPKPRDWIGPIKLATKSNDFVIIPELKRLEPSSGSLRKRFDLSKITKQFTLAGAPALSVNCDSVLFGGSIDELLQAREAASKAILDFTGADEGVIAPPLLASDLLLYPYQLYKLRLAGADAVNLIAGALASKDLLYLSKIAASLKMQIIASVTSEVQIESISKLGKGSVSAIVVSNRDLETFGFDDSGEQALSMLKSDAMKEFKKLYDGDIPVLVEGRVGIIEMEGQDGSRSTQGYIRALKSAGANGAIVGQGIATVEKEDIKEVLESMSNA